MNVTLGQLIARWKDDPGATYRTWFLKDQQARTSAPSAWA